MTNRLNPLKCRWPPLTRKIHIAKRLPLMTSFNWFTIFKKYFFIKWKIIMFWNFSFLALLCKIYFVTLRKS